MSIGTATMRADRSVVLRLRAEGEDGTIGDAYFEYSPGDTGYDDVIKHAPGLEPGVTKLVSPWP